ncbi:MAG: hypothetical protein ABIP55_12760 [Tepidisphaeraceae bacterium]
MANAWQSLEEAALTLGISSRTLHRRLARGEFETRLENGRREVLVVITEPEQLRNFQVPSFHAVAEAMSDASTRLADTSDDPSANRIGTTEDEGSDSADKSAGYTEKEEEPAASEVGDDVQHAMLTLHEDRIRRTDLAIMAYQQSVNVTAADARRAHLRNRIAWGVAGGLIVMAFLGAVWATHTVTKARGDVDHMNQLVRQLSDTAQTTSTEADRLRADAQTARVAAARVEGQLEAARAQIEQLRTAAQAVPAAYSTPQTSAPATTQPVPATTQPAVSLSEVIDRITLR